MNQRLFYLLACSFGFWAFLAHAETTPSPTQAVYNIANVAVDVTADSAAKARDQVIAEAQHSAFTMLLQRLGTDSSLGAKLSENDLATLVQNFEVRDERASSVRYIGRFSVQFRPSAVRTYLHNRHAAFNDAQGQPVLIIPITKNGNVPVLWQQPTPWFAAWSKAVQDGGLVPVIVPTGTPEDQTLLSATDAMMGRVESVKSLIDTYHTNGAVVAVLNGSFDNSAAGFTIDVQHFGTGFDDGSEVEHITLPPVPDKTAIPDALSQAAQQIRQKIEKDYRDNYHGAIVDTATPNASPSPTSTAENTTNPDDLSATTPVTVDPPIQTGVVNRLAVTVQFSTLTEWADIQRRLLASSGVKRVDIASVGHGVTLIELGFTGKPEDIQLSVAQHGLRLTQDILSGDWVLKGL